MNPPSEICDSIFDINKNKTKLPAATCSNIIGRNNLTDTIIVYLCCWIRRPLLSSPYHNSYCCWPVYPLAVIMDCAMQSASRTVWPVHVGNSMPASHSWRPYGLLSARLSVSPCVLVDGQVHDANVRYKIASYVSCTWYTHNWYEVSIQNRDWTARHKSIDRHHDQSKG